MHDPIRWISRNILKGNPDGVGLNWMSWGSDFWTYWTHYREQHVHLESSDFRDISNQRNSSDQVLSRLRSSSGVGNPISPSLTSLGLRNPCEIFLYLNCGHDMKPIGWWSYRVRVKCSLVLLEIFIHPVQLWCSPIPIRKVYWGHPSSGLGNLKCTSIYTIASLQIEGGWK